MLRAGGAAAPGTDLHPLIHLPWDDVVRRKTALEEVGAFTISVRYLCPAGFGWEGQATVSGQRRSCGAAELGTLRDPMEAVVVPGRVSFELQPRLAGEQQPSAGDNGVAGLVAEPACGDQRPRRRGVR